MGKRLPVIVPVYKADLTPSEWTRLKITHSSNSDMIFVAPEHLRFWFKKRFPITGQLEFFPDSFFSSTRTYNRLLLSLEFWSRFNYLEYFVLCQTDAVIIKDIRSLGEAQYSYIGSSWTPKKCRLLLGRIYEDYRKHMFLPYRLISVGNGGLSFRNVRDSVSVLTRLHSLHRMRSLLDGNTNEDMVFSYFFNVWGFRLPDISTADAIFMEQRAQMFNELPDIYGFHALGRFNPILEEVLFTRFDT